MPIRSGQILHVHDQFVIDRAQTAGVDSLNIPEEKIYETGNKKAVGVVRDNPELSFTVESLDTTTEIEALLLGIDPTTTAEGDEFDLSNAIPLDIVSPFKRSYKDHTVVGGVTIPFLTLASATYRFGVRANATQAFTLNGDGNYYASGTPISEKHDLVDGQLTYNLDQTADITFDDAGEIMHVIGASVRNPTTATYKRLFFGSHYTDTTTTITLEDDWFDLGYTELAVVYATTDANTFPQSVHANDLTLKPAAVRGAYIDVYVASGGATSTLNVWGGVQSVEVTQTWNVEADEELGNRRAVAQDWDTAEVSGNIVFRPTDFDDFMERIRQITNTTAGEVTGPNSSQPLEMEIRIKHPDTGAYLKTLYVPDARFQMPALTAQVQTKQDITMAFSSDEGSLIVIQGERD